MPSQVVDIDRGYRAMVRRFRRYGVGPNVTVGIQGTEAAETREFGVNNASLAAVHEFGSRDGRIPQRSFLRSTVDRERERIQRLLERGARRAVTGEAVERALGLVGEFTRGQMVRTIDQSIDIKPLAQSTIARRRYGGTTPLVDEGILKRSITWKVHKR